ncbi:MAG: DUF4062 domain-containing protein [Candidatus Methanofastidiosia archaeon]|jgi:hypothetical protein
MVKNIKQHVSVFISSTYKDLIPHRKAVLDTLEKLKIGINGMEIFGARSEEPLTTCLEEVSKCQVFIGIIGMRYGTIDNNTKKSIVRLEYETALKKQQDILIYLINEDKAQIAPKFVDTGESAVILRKFKDLLRKSHTIETFLSPKDLAEKVERDLLRLFSDSGLHIEEEKLLPLAEPKKIKKLLWKFDLTPERFSGREAELILKFTGDPLSVTKSVCRAINLRFGQSIKRPIMVLDPPGASEEFSFLKYLYAEYDGCDFLYDASTDEELKVIAKLAFGQERKFVWQTDLAKIKMLFSQSILTNLSAIPETKIKDLETGEVFENYITHSPLKAIVFVKKS